MENPLLRTLRELQLLDDEQLRRTGLSVQNVIDRMRQENINVAGGTLTEGRTEYMVRTINEYSSLEQIADTIVEMRDDRAIRIRDLGEVRWSHKERQITTRTEGADSVQIEIFKEADANIVALAQRVKARVGELDREALEAPVAAAEEPGRIRAITTWPSTYRRVRPVPMRTGAPFRPLMRVSSRSSSSSCTACSAAQAPSRSNGCCETGLSKRSPFRPWSRCCRSGTCGSYRERQLRWRSSSKERMSATSAAVARH